MNKIIFVNSCIQCPYGEIDITDTLYCRRSAGRDIGHEDKVKHIPRWCELTEVSVNNNRKQ